VQIEDADAGITGPDTGALKAKSLSGPGVYYIGIVDFLQDWSFRKKLERNFKIYVTRKDPDGLSVMHPTPYMHRFQEKMAQVFDVSDESSQSVSSKSGCGIVATISGSPSQSTKKGVASSSSKTESGSTIGQPVVNALHGSSSFDLVGNSLIAGGGRGFVRPVMSVAAERANEDDELDPFDTNI